MVSQKLLDQQMKYMNRGNKPEISNWVYYSPQTLPEEIRRNFADSTGQFNMEVYTRHCK
jgi:hypothetical protein